MDVQMPQLGETVTEGTITRWLKRVGDRIESDEPLFEVSTDKVDSEVPAPRAGYLTEIRVPEGETVGVGTVLAVIGDAAATTAPEASVEPAPVPPEPGRAPRACASAAGAPAPVPPEPAPLPPEPPEPAPVLEAEGAPADPRVSSPVVRRLLTELGLSAAEVPGTGPDGRITRRDVLDADARRGSAPAAPAAGPASAPEPPPPVVVAPEPATAAAAATPAGLHDSVVPFSPMRQRIAEHMVRSRATSAHAYVSVEVDFEHVERVRAAHRESWRAREGFSLTYLPFIARAVSDTFDDFPVVNASVVDDALVLHDELHLAIAVDLKFQGLIAPVVHQADSKRLRQIAREVHDLATRARDKQLSPDDVAGGTFTITNPGPYGTYLTLPIINQPQVAILATDGISKRPVVVEAADGGDVLAVRHTGLLTLGWDHRAFDGAYAAAFLNAMRDVLQSRDWEAELE